jgi:uncharacterized membrane protein
MTDQQSTPEASAPATSAPTEQDQEAVVGLVTDGAHALIIARFPTMEETQEAYQALRELERTTSLQIDGVVIASSDANGKITLGQVTDHSTKTGLKWGIVGGVLLGIVFPPSIIGSAVALGGTGAVLGKVRNVLHRKGLAEELAEVMTPGTSGILALVQDTAVVAVRDAMAKADRIVEKAVDEQLAAEVDREAANDKAAAPAS